MKEMIEWLIKIEGLAHNFYSEVAVRFADDAKMAKFFRRIADEETWHQRVLEHETENSARRMAPSFGVSLDKATRERIEAPFIKNSELLAAGGLSRENAIDCLARSEFSEWNDIFVYVIKSLKKEREFMPVAAKLDGHLKRIEQFMETMPEGRRHLYMIRSLPRVWREHILILDGDPAVAEFLGKLLEHDGHVETARDGTEGLRQLKEKHFDVVISGVSMPGMDGMEFYRLASEYDRGLGKRIIFLPDSPAGGHIDFLRKNNLKYLVKPVPVRKIVSSVRKILREISVKG